MLYYFKKGGVGMDHSEWIREVPESKNAVLMVHGILGTPRHFDVFLPLIPGDWSVYNILLDGHGAKVTDFSRSSMKKWKAQTAARLDDLLKRYDRVILVAHSMGTLFSLQEAAARPEKIAGLFLLQTPLRPRLKLRYACYSALMPLGIVPKAAVDMIRGSSITLSPWLWQYLGWIPRFAELFIECRRTRKMLDQVTVPCRVFQSAKDEMVSMRTCRDLSKHPRLSVTVLPDSGHFAYHGADLELLKTEFSKLFA